MLVIDGSMGEGGGQVLRTSLALSLVTGTPFRIANIRARRSKPGLLRQHLTCVEAAKAVGAAEVEGARPGSTEVVFRPSRLHGGTFSFAVGTAGSTTLVLQSVLPALALAPEPSTLVIEGGTHNLASPPFDFLARALAPLLHRMGVGLELSLERPGYYPAGGGKLVARVTPVAKLRPVFLHERGEVTVRRATALVSHLPGDVAVRERDVMLSTLGWDASCGHVVTRRDSIGPGNVAMVEVGSEHVTELFTAFGEKSDPAERVADEVAQRALYYMSSGVPVWEQLADQLVPWLSLAGDGGFVSCAPDLHARTQLELVPRFLDAAPPLTPRADGSFLFGR